VIVAIMYTATQMIFAAVIPKDLLFTKGGIDVGGEFFHRTLGNTTKVTTIWSVIKAYSAFGNIIVVTFTAARVKQEVRNHYSRIICGREMLTYGSRLPRKESYHTHSFSHRATISTFPLSWARSLLNRTMRMELYTPKKPPSQLWPFTGESMRLILMLITNPLEGFSRPLWSWGQSSPSNQAQNTPQPQHRASLPAS
jgi:hypothetical protein